MKTITIGKNDAGMRLDKFLIKTFPNLPAAALYKGIRKKDVKRNGKRCHIDDRLVESDQITLYLKDDFFQKAPADYDFLKAPNQLKVVYEDENLILLDKKPGLLVHPDENYHFDSLLARLQHYLYQKGEYRPELENSFAPALVNRIDRNTGGIVIAAKTAESLRILNEKMKLREIEKTYLCLVHGYLQNKSATLTAYLEKNEAKNRVYISNQPGANKRSIQTRYRVLDEQSGLSLLEVHLLTGRTHQIRAQFAHLGHPLAGDGKYGTNRLNHASPYPFQALYSFRLSFQFDTAAGVLSYLNGQTFEAEDIWFLKEFYHTPT